MNRQGFEALADGVMLLTVLLVASTLALSMSGGPSHGIAGDSARYAEDTRVALFRSTLDGLAFVQNGAAVLLPNGTTVEGFLRLQVHLVSRNVGMLDFDAANDRITEIATTLLRPGWSYSVVGRVTDGPGVTHLPEVVVLPETYAASSWSYPPLDGSGPDTVLSLFAWLSPRR